MALIHREIRRLSIQKGVVLSETQGTALDQASSSAIDIRSDRPRCYNSRKAKAPMGVGALKNSLGALQRYHGSVPDGNKKRKSIP